MNHFLDYADLSELMGGCEPPPITAGMDATAKAEASAYWRVFDQRIEAAYPGRPRIYRHMRGMMAPEWDAEDAKRHMLEDAA